MTNKKIKIGQEELDQYKFDRQDIALMLGKTTNAIRMMMRKSNCTLEYRFDGKKFWFKRPRDYIVNRPLSDHHEKAVNQLHNKIQKKYNRGATHKGKGKYPNDAFKLQNEMKILNSIGGKFRSESHRREFDNLNEEALKIAQENLRKKAEKSMGGYHGRPKYGGMVRGNRSIWDLPYDLDSPRLSGSSFHIGGKPYSEYETIKEEPEGTTYTWSEPKTKDPGADYKPGRFKHLDEAIRNTKKK